MPDWKAGDIFKYGIDSLRGDRESTESIGRGKSSRYKVILDVIDKSMGYRMGVYNMIFADYQTTQELPTDLVDKNIRNGGITYYGNTSESDNYFTITYSGMDRTCEFHIELYRYISVRGRIPPSDEIEYGYLFSATRPPSPSYIVLSSGEEDGLSEGMVMLRRKDGKEVLETQENISEAVKRGMWVPLKEVF